MLALHYARFMDLGTSWSFKTAKQVFMLPHRTQYL